MSVSTAVMVSGMAVSSPPVAAVTSRSGASATALTVTSNVLEMLAVSPEDNSVEVAVTVRLISSLSSAGGVMVRPSSWASVNVALPSTIGIDTPSDKFKTVPSGILEISIDKISEPSVSVKTDEISREIALSSSPSAGSTVSSGVPAVSSTPAETFTEVLAVSLFSDSVDVAVTSRFSAVSDPVGTNNVSPSSSPEVSVTSPVTGSTVPAERVAPSGSPLTTMDKSSDPSVSTNELSMFNGNSVPPASSPPKAPGVTDATASSNSNPLSSST